MVVDLPSRDPLKAGEQLLRISIGVVGCRRNSLNHPTTKLRHQFKADLLLLLIRKLFVFGEYRRCVTRKLHFFGYVVQVEQIVLDLFAPVQISFLDLSRLMNFEQISKLETAERLVTLDLGFVFVVGHQHTIHSQKAHVTAKVALLKLNYNSL